MGVHVVKPAHTHPRATIRRALALCAASGLLGACTNADSYLDPSRLGRWEKTATIVPILDRIGVIEAGTSEQIDYSDVQPEDLIPEISAYRIGPADVIEVTVRDLFVRNVPERLTREVDRRGYIDIPQLGEIYVDGSTRERVQKSIEDAMRAKQITQSPVVSVVILSPRKQTFNIIGSVTGGGTFGVPRADFRLMDALSSVGGFNERAEFIYIIRHIPLSAEAAGATTPPASDAGPQTPDQGVTPPPGTPSGEDLLKVIDDLTGGEGAPTSPPPEQGSPQPPAGDTPPIGLPGDDPPIALPSVMEPGGATIRRNPDAGRPAAVPLAEREASPANVTQPTASDSTGAQWMYLNGKWVLVQRAVAPPPDATGAAPEPTLVTQRVIRVPLKSVLDGDARYNLVIRPGDTIRVPRPLEGTFYVTGEIARGGSFQITDKMTVIRAIATAGGLGNLAIPERVDLTRLVGENRQATVRLNLAAIHEGTQPDIFLKDGDVLNIGTNFWAVPLAVVRGGFRATYGFGFLLDRNFGNDVFGAPPTNRQN